MQHFKKKTLATKNEKPIEVVTRFTKNDPVTISPFKDEVWKEIEKLGGMVWTRHTNNGFCYKIAFDSSLYGACVIKCNSSKGHEKDLFELCVLDLDGHPCYDTDIGTESLQFLTDGDVMSVLRVIARLDDNGHVRKLDK